jgi:hypothetical protein
VQLQTTGGRGGVDAFVQGDEPNAHGVVQAVRLNVLDGDGKRLLHAKAFEILCARGRIVVSGSANGTNAALGRDRNVEVCIARLQRARMMGWSLSASHPPEPQAALDEEHKNEDHATGVLRAVLEGDQGVPFYGT